MKKVDIKRYYDIIDALRPEYDDIKFLKLEDLVGKTITSVCSHKEGFILGFDDSALRISYWPDIGLIYIIPSVKEK